MRIAALALFLAVIAAPLAAADNEKLAAMQFPDGRDYTVADFAGKTVVVHAFCRS